jgi:hypothetical protein
LARDDGIDAFRGQERQILSAGLAKTNVSIRGIGGLFLGLRDHAGGGIGGEDVVKVLREAAGDEAMAAAEIEEGGFGAAVVLEDEGVE